MLKFREIVIFFGFWGGAELGKMDANRRGMVIEKRW